MTDPPIDITQAREQDAPGTHDAKRQAPVHGHTGDLPSDKALSDTCLVKGDPRDPDIGRLAHVLSAILVSIRARPRMDYVRSAANIADLPSRFDIEGLWAHSYPPPDTIRI
eukprot:scaffold7414_cov119-Isochrysis_galbana.AAC.1